MPRLSPDLYFTGLILDYLSDADSLTFGVPDNTTLPKARLDSGKTAALPQLTILGSEESSKSGTGYRRTVNVICMLHAAIRNADANAPTDAASTARTTTRDTAAEWIQTIEDRLRDHSALSDFIEARDDADNDGTVILKIIHQHQPQIERQEGAAHVLSLAVALEVHFVWSRTA